MTASTFADLAEHTGHKIEVATYGPAEAPVNAAVECATCSVVLVDFDRDPSPQQAPVPEGDDYLVTWQINVDAEDESGESWGAANPTEAAMRAGIILMGASHLADRMADPDAATVFDVTDRRTGAMTRVDLSDNNEREV